jgi:hypothetical protein
MKMGSIYSASDKALFDALNQVAVTNLDLRQLFLTHGVIISKHTPRHELAMHFSRLLHDYEDFQALARLFDTGQRRERVASFRINSKAILDDFENALHHVVANLRDSSDAASVSRNDDGSLKINVRYKKFHFNKSEFRQIETKDAVITVEQEGGSIVIRGPQNDKVDEISREVISYVEAQVQGDLDIDEITLETHPSPSDRTKFFVTLIDSVAGYKRHDVTDVYVYKPKLEVEPSEENESDDDDESDTNLGVHISRASLKGVGVLESAEMKNLIDRGFYISKIVWQAVEASFDSDIYEFEAQFTEPESCTRFSYLCRGYYKYLGEKEYSKSKNYLPPDEDRQLSKVIEAASRTSLMKLKETS